MYDPIRGTTVLQKIFSSHQRFDSMEYTQNAHMSKDDSSLLTDYIQCLKVTSDQGDKSFSLSITGLNYWKGDMVIVFLF